MKKNERLNPRIDIAFKKIFGVEENKSLLISLINSIINTDEKITEIVILNPYNNQNHKTDKLSILDIKATNEKGLRFNIEMQITDEGDYSQRALYYWAKVYTEQIGVGGSYEALDKTIGIHLLNFSCIPGERYHHQFHIYEDQSKERYFDKFEIHTLELSKFSSPHEDFTDLVHKIKTSLDSWMLFLTRNELLTYNHLPKLLEDEHINKAIHVLDIMNLNAIEREIYENREKFLMIEASALVHQFNKGEAIGLEKGKAEGKLEEKREMALKMLQKNMLSDTDIADLTGLSLEEIGLLKKDT